MPLEPWFVDQISIHALLAESDQISDCCCDLEKIFLSTLSLRRATHHLPQRTHRHADFYPRSPCGERPGLAAFNTDGYSDFYPRSPCGERRRHPRSRRPGRRFLSTLSLRRATPARQKAGQSRADFYPRSPCGERRKFPRQSQTDHRISIHALLAESDVRAGVFYCRKAVFLSTLSLRRATVNVQLHCLFLRISIHALLAESDCSSVQFGVSVSLFLSTLSLRRATTQKAQKAGSKANFYPRSPCGERP